MQAKRKSGRPRKAEHEKAQYQRIAVFRSDYTRLIDFIGDKVDLVEAFGKMVTGFIGGGRSYTKIQMDWFTNHVLQEELKKADERIRTEFDGDWRAYRTARQNELVKELDDLAHKSS